MRCPRRHVRSLHLGKWRYDDHLRVGAACSYHSRHYRCGPSLCRIRPSGGDHRRRHPHQQKRRFKAAASSAVSKTPWQRAKVGFFCKSDDLEHLRAQARAAQHAIDPIRFKEGPVRAFGVKKAAQGIVSYVTAAGKNPNAWEKMRSYSRWVAVSA